MANERLCIVIPVYNEEAAIGAVLAKWSAELDRLGIDYTIRPYNDGSKDSSLAVLRAAAERNARIDVRDKPNGGHGHTVLTGYRDAAKDGFDWVFQVDSDDEMGPEKFKDLWQRRNDFDFLVGRRAGRTQALPRKIISFVSRLTVRLFYGKSTVWDVNAPYRLMRVSAFRDAFFNIPARTFAPNVILTGIAAQKRLRALEIPVPQHDRTTGEVSIRKWKLLKAAARSLWQTIAFSSRFFDAFIAALPALVALSMIDLTTVLWYDELCMGDGVFMKALHGLTWSGVWACSYNPLYPMLMVVWTKLFGASHFAFCSFTVLCGYLSSLLLLGIAHRRGLFHGRLADAAFVALFWGGWHFAWSLTCGRVDVLMLLLTAGFVHALVPVAGERRNPLAIFTWALAMMLTAPYTLPVLFILGLVLLAYTKDRKDIVLRGIFAALGIGVAFIANCTYYLVQHDLIRFLGSYIYFNSLTGFKSAPFAERLINGYLYDYTALALCAFGILCGKLKPRESLAAAFIALIPLLMLLGGRYETYYAWAFFIPALILAATAAFRRGKGLCITLLCCGAALFIARQAKTCESSASARANRDLCRAFVRECAGLIPSGSDVVVAADLDGNTGFYYPLVNLGARVWYRGPEMLTGRTDEEKFSEGLALIASTPERKQELKNFIRKIQRFIPMLPERGFVLFYSDADVTKIKPMFENHGFKLQPLSRSGSFSLWKLER